MGGSSAPSPDPRVGEAAVMSADTGRLMLEFMQTQAGITNQWAVDDRERDIEVFRPLQDRFIAEAQTWDSPERQNQQAAAAAADVNIAGRQQLGAMNREAAAMGIDPRSGRYAAARGRMGADLSLGAAGASNLARRQVRAEGDARRAQAINLGSGLAINPGTSMGLSNNATQAGFGGAMQGYGQMGSLLNSDYQNRLAAWNANNQSQMGLFGGLGALAGAFFPSSKEIKHDKTPSTGNLQKLEQMPVEDWTYNEGQGDGGRHTGPYAEDFAAATGKGDGKSIPVVDAIGITMGAVKELGAKVDMLAAKMGGDSKVVDIKQPSKTVRPAMGAMKMAA